MIATPRVNTKTDSPPPEGSCEKIEIKFDCGSPRPNGERGWGVRGIAVLPQRAFVFPHLERFFSLSWNSMRHASPPLTPGPHPWPLSLVGARGTEIV